MQILAVIKSFNMPKVIPAATPSKIIKMYDLTSLSVDDMSDYFKGRFSTKFVLI